MIYILLISSKGELFQVCFSHVILFCIIPHVSQLHPDSRHGSSRQVALLHSMPAVLLASLSMEWSVGQALPCKQACWAQKCWGVSSPGTTFNSQWDARQWVDVSPQPSLGGWFWSLSALLSPSQWNWASVAVWCGQINHTPLHWLSLLPYFNWLSFSLLPPAFTK